MGLANIVDQHLINHWMYFKHTADSNYIEGPELNYILAPPYNRILSATTDALPKIDKIIMEQKTGADPLMWIAGPSNTVDLMNIKNKGFAFLDRWKGMTLELSAHLGDYRKDPDFEFVKVSNERELREWVDVYINGYQKPIEGKTDLIQRFAQIINCEQNAYQLYLGRYQNTPAVAGSLFIDDQGVAGLYCITTAQEMRRKGLATLYLQGILHKAYLNGSKLCILHATEAGEPAYAKLGFESCCDIQVYLKNS